MAEEKVKKTKIKLKDNTVFQGGNPCREGQVIEVRTDQAKRLIEAGSAEAA